jgi:Uma2 family endonuclease
MPKKKNIENLKLELIQWIAQSQELTLLEKLLESKKEEEQKNKEKESKSLILKEKSYYSKEDLDNIKNQFPKDKKWTYQDLLNYFPKNLKHKVEILNNQLIIMASPSFLHQKISMKLSREMSYFAEKHKLGEVLTAPMDTKFDENNVEQPDILFISITRFNLIEKNVINGAPDLIVEIISPANKKKERQEKHDLYERKGVKEYWTIFPKKKEIIVEVLENEKYTVFSKGKKTGTIQSSVLEGFEVSVEDIIPESLEEK